MFMRGVIIKDDERYQYTESYLVSKGYEFAEPRSAPEKLDFLIFPFKTEIDQRFYDSNYFKRLNPETPVFSGVEKAYISEMCKVNGLKYYPMMQDKDVNEKNAIPTSEGVISYLITNRTVPVCGSKILVAGYGVCGSDLARRLKALGAEVFALVRNEEKKRMARKDSVIPVFIEEYGCHVFDVVINTVPERVFTDKMLDMQKGALFVDIASKPYGFDIEYAKTLNAQSALLPGIPGKYAVRYAGELLGKFIYDKRG